MLLSVVAVALDWYPQFLACEVILLLWTDPVKALRKKRNMEREVLEFEAFTESLPTLLILICMWTQWSRALNDEVAALTIGGSKSLDPFFVLTFTTSSVAIVVGFYKNLVLGPCRAHTHSIFCLVFLFLSVFSSFVIKIAIVWVVLFNFHLDNFRDKLTSWTIFRDTVWPLLPQILTTILALPFPMTITHPSFILVPLFTWYTFSGSNSCYSKIVNYTKKIICNCVSKKRLRKLWPLVKDANETKQKNVERGYQESFIRFSPGWTLLNIGFSVSNYITYAIIYWNYIVDQEIVRFGLLLGINLPGMLLTCWFAINDKQDRQFITWLVYNSSDIHTEYILVKENSSFTIRVWKGAVLSHLETGNSIPFEFCESGSASIFFSSDVETQSVSKFGSSDLETQSVLLCSFSRSETKTSQRYDSKQIFN